MILNILGFVALIAFAAFFMFLLTTFVTAIAAERYSKERCPRCGGQMELTDYNTWTGDAELTCKSCGNKRHYPGNNHYVIDKTSML